jgi:hypothetical protein
MLEIDLSELTNGGEVHNLSGHERGVAAREHFRLEDADASEESVRVIVPAYIYTLTPSFFQGMFAASVHASGNDRAKFFSRYKFAAPAVVLQQIERGIAAVRTRRGDILSS